MRRSLRDSVALAIFIVSGCAALANAAKPVQFAGYAFQNKGPVAFGVIPADLVDSVGDTIGGIGSAIVVKPGTWTANKDGTFTGTLVVHPDSGPHGLVKLGYRTRQHEVDFTLAPYTGTANLNATNALRTLKLTYKNTVVKVDSNQGELGGMDPAALRAATGGWPAVPIVSKEQPFLTIDGESLVADTDGTFWLGDEYGPYIYRFSSSGRLQGVVQPPRAFLPFDASGALNFTSDVNPRTGRVVGQGFEGLTFDYSTRTLYAILQSALVQDGGSDDTTSRYTRLVAFDVSQAATTVPVVGRLKGEWVVPLPSSSSKAKTRAVSEVAFVGNGVFLALSRDGDGRGGKETKSSYKQIDLFSIKSATDIAGSKYDDPANPVAPGGKLASGIVAAEYISFLDLLDKDDLAKLGLHNGDPDDWTLIASRYEALALAPICDPAFKDDYFLFAASDNNFVTTRGVAVGKPFNEGLDVDNQFLVYRVTLPSIPRGSVERGLGIPSC